MNEKFPKNQKLKKKNDIAALFEKGKWKSCEPLRVIYLHGDQESPKIGVSVSKKYFKKAVDRNRIKRLLRECYRLNKTVFRENFGNNCTAMFFYASKEMPKSYRTLEENFKQLCEKVKK